MFHDHHRAAALSQTFPAEMPLRSAPFDAVTNDIYNMASSAAYKSIVAGLIPLMSDPGFLPLLRSQPPEIILSIIPADVRIAVRLPDDPDPALTNTQKGVLELIVVVGGAVLTVVLTPAVLLTLPVIGGILVVEAAGSILAWDEILNGQQVGQDP